ncbi:unnamed protein product [Arctogadus glacialis]
MQEVDKSRLIHGRKGAWREKGEVVVRVVGAGRAPLGPRRWDQTLPFSGFDRRKGPFEVYSSMASSEHGVADRGNTPRATSPGQKALGKKPRARVHVFSTH